jgi:hypothetical protein
MRRTDEIRPQERPIVIRTGAAIVGVRGLVIAEPSIIAAYKPCLWLQVKRLDTRLKVMRQQPIISIQEDHEFACAFPHAAVPCGGTLLSALPNIPDTRKSPSHFSRIIG